MAESLVATPGVAVSDMQTIAERPIGGGDSDRKTSSNDSYANSFSAASDSVSYGDIAGNYGDVPEGKELVGQGGVELEATYYGIEDSYGLDEDKLWTASGERFDPYGLSAATLLYPLGTILYVTYGRESVVVRVNDRCGGCVLDLSRAAFEQLAPLSRGRITVLVQEGR